MKLCAPGIDEDDDRLLLEKPFDLQFLQVGVAGGVSCSKGVAAIGGRQGSDVHSCCGGGQQRLQRKIAVGSFLPQGSLLAAIKENDSKRSLLAALGSERCVLWLKG
ncbi:hypothetical protein BHE74_00023352 [Ensete ventricosum]|nr:hypothetical protein BHE74_00023352 [Ensete ventricosum]